MIGFAISKAEKQKRDRNTQLCSITSYEKNHE